MAEHTFTPLKLKAKDNKDIQILSTFLQDALVPIHGMDHDEKNKHFALLAFRYRWELAQDKSADPKHERVNTGLSITNVEKVVHKGFHRQKEHGHTLNLLMIEKKEGCIVLIFSGHAELKLYAKDPELHLQDIGEPWPASGRPRHLNVAL